MSFTRRAASWVAGILASATVAVLVISALLVAVYLTTDWAR